MKLYSIRHLAQEMTGRIILDIDHLDLESGGIYGLLGPNGAGKTTLLNLLAFLDRPTRGQLFFRNQPVPFREKEMRLFRRQVVLLDQYPILFTTTVYRNLEFGLRVRKIPRSKRERLIDEALDLVDMQSFKHAPATTLSGGETQRIALARALVVAPRVFLCDEPTASVDVENQATIISLLQLINREKDITIIFTTHDRQLAATLAHRTLVLNHGRLTRTGCDNIFSCEIKQLSSDRICCQLHGQCVLTLPADGRQWPIGRQRLWIDPAGVTLRLPDDKQTNSPISGRLKQLSMEGNLIRATVDIGLPLTVALEPSEYKRLNPSIGETFKVEIGMEAVRFLAET